MAIHPGDNLAGYRVTRLLGRGGMGEVWAASRDGLDVAIKVLLPRAAMKPDLVRRFEREARIASAIESPFVCRLIEVATGADGSHLLVFEHLSGESLADRLKREQYLPFSEVGPIIDDVLQGLSAAHAAGVVHRDLKPGNIFLVRQGEGEGERAKILDFGISKLRRDRGQREPTLTGFDATLGSFAYMAPEQVRGAARADERADIYAVGAVAFRALSGRLPFDGPTAPLLIAMKLDRSAPSLAEATGDQWPAGLERFLERALDRHREKRFGDAGEALAAWRGITSRAGSSASIVVPPPAPPPPEAHAPQPPRSRAPASVPRSAVVAPPAPSTSKGPSGVIPAPTKPVITVYNQPPPTFGAPPSRSGGLEGGGAPRRPVTFGAPPAPAVPVPPRAITFGEPPPPADAPPAPPPRPPMQSYQVVEDNPTEVDGPPTMTIDGSFPIDPPDSPKKRRTGRP